MVELYFIHYKSREIVVFNIIYLYIHWLMLQMETLSSLRNFKTILSIIFFVLISNIHDQAQGCMYLFISMYNDLCLIKLKHFFIFLKPNYCILLLSLFIWFWSFDLLSLIYKIFLKFLLKFCYSFFQYISY